MKLHVLLAALILTPAAALRAADFVTALEVDVLDKMDFSLPLGRDIVLNVSRDGTTGWYLTATDRRLPNSPNFFYDCLCGHGPRPHEMYAWHFVDMYFPSDRILPIHGYPLEVRVRCLECKVEKSGQDVHFVSGKIEVSWRRLPASNPRQLHISDVVRK